MSSTTTLTGVLTNLGRQLLAQSLGNVGGFSLVRVSSFAFGEGGFVSTGGGKVPKTPDPTRSTIEATGAAGNSRFQKALAPSDVAFIAPSTIEFRCKLNPSEANDNGAGAPPEFFELGLFDDNNNLIAYTTFDEQTKTATKTLITYVQIFF